MSGDLLNAAYSVGEITSEIKHMLGDAFAEVVVRGQVSNLRRQRSGHVYFSLKDEDAQLVCAMWRSYAGRLRFRPEEGHEVLAIGGIDVYPPHGKYQLIVRELLPLGAGALHVRFERLKARLLAEGLFDEERKRPLPFLCRRTAVVTSPTTAALRDFLRIQRRRMPSAAVTVFPVRVQGETSADEVCAALGQIERAGGFDAVAVIRGGGSIEDLWSFNEERTARAIAGCALPVVVGVGHETDTTIADLAADVRAATPSEAAEMLFVEATALEARLAEWGGRLRRAVVGRVEQARERIDAIATSAALSRPVDRLRRVGQDVDDLELRALRALELRTSSARERLDRAVAHLGAVSPLAVLGRGYSITTRAGERRPLRDASGVRAGTELETRLAGGRVTSVVSRTQPDESPNGEIA